MSHNCTCHKQTVTKHTHPYPSSTSNFTWIVFSMAENPSNELGSTVAQAEGNVDKINVLMVAETINNGVR